MIKKIITLLAASCFILIGCSNTDENLDVNESSINSSFSYSAPKNTSERLTISNDSISSSPYSKLSELLFLPDKYRDNKLTNIQFPSESGYIKSNLLVNNYDFSIESIVTNENNLYFTNISDGNSIYKLDYLKNDITKIKTISARNLTIANNKLFFINVDSNQKLNSLDINTNKIESVVNEKVGKYIISGDYILYQNLDDNSSLYSIKADGSNRMKLSDFSVDSFSPLNGQLYISNSADNNNLYTYDPITNSCKRVALIEATNIKTHNGSIYYINPLDNTLHKLLIDIDKNQYTSSEVLFRNVNNYYPLDNLILLETSNNINQTYVLNIN